MSNEDENQGETPRSSLPVGAKRIKGPPMSDELKALIEKARHYVMTPEERREQLIGMAYGNLHFYNPSVTRKDIGDAAERLERRMTEEGEGSSAI